VCEVWDQMSQWVVITALLQCLDQLKTSAVHEMVQWLSDFWMSNNNNKMAVVSVDDNSL